jgi:IS30 family transposase
MSYSHLNTLERVKLETLHHLGWSTRQIAKSLNRHHASIARELKRNAIDNKTYHAETASRLAIRRQMNRKHSSKCTFARRVIIEEKLRLTWSPEQISNGLPDLKISFKTIYRWIYSGLINKGKLNLLRHKGKRRSPYETRGRFIYGPSIQNRPSEVKTRHTFGHWELDTVVSGRGKSKHCLATFAERKTRYYVAVPMENRTASSMKQAIQHVFSEIPTQGMKTATVDRGKEFSCYQDVYDELGINIYFADPYSAWQRGTNENSNGLLREFFPKGTCFDDIPKSKIKYAIQLINHRPRKCLGWKSAHEAFMEELSHLA